MRAIFFYPSVAILAAATIVLSLNTAMAPHVAAPQAGATQMDGALLFGPAALAHVDVSPAQEFYLQRDDAGDAKSIQIATKPDRAGPTLEDQGVRLLLAPEAGAALAGKPLRIALRVRPLLYTTAPKVAVRLQTAAPTEWTALPFPHTVIERAGDDPATTSAWLRFDLPAVSGAPQAIAIWPYDDEPRDPEARFQFNTGIEIIEIRVSEAPPTVGSISSPTKFASR